MIKPTDVVLTATFNYVRVISTKKKTIKTAEFCAVNREIDAVMLILECTVTTFHHDG